MRYRLQYAGIILRLRRKSRAFNAERPRILEPYKNVSVKIGHSYSTFSTAQSYVLFNLRYENFCLLQDSFRATFARYANPLARYN